MFHRMDFAVVRSNRWERIYLASVACLWQELGGHVHLKALSSHLLEQTAVVGKFLLLRQLCTKVARMNYSILPDGRHDVFIHLHSCLSSRLFFCLVRCKPICKLLLEDFSLLHAVFFILRCLLLQQLHLLSQGVNHVLHLAITIGFSPISVLLGCAITLLLDPLDLCLKFRLHACITSGNLRTNTFAVPFDLIHSSLDCCSVVGFSIISRCLRSCSHGLLVCKTRLFPSLCFTPGLFHLVFSFFAFSRILSAVFLFLILHPLIFVLKPKSHGVLLSFPSILLRFPPAFQASKTLPIDCFHLVFLRLNGIVLCLRNSFVLFHLVEHVLSLLLPSSFSLGLHLSKFLHLIVKHAFEFPDLGFLSSLSKIFVLLTVLESVKGKDQIPVVHRLHLWTKRNRKFGIDLDPAALTGVVINHDGCTIRCWPPHLLWIEAAAGSAGLRIQC
mmetsp:Transcript_55042/g.98144  ORF Transcript_55042/g.98144 Transcript_55042/m.98144 type:complete len:443 (-) Transcript_55042:396-1724(-)